MGFKVTEPVMEAGRAELVEWARANRLYVEQKTRVVDCVGQRAGPGVQKGSALLPPGVSLALEISVDETMGVDEECRLHGCGADECLEVQTKCPDMFMESDAEVTCSVYSSNEPVYKCTARATRTLHVDQFPLFLGAGWGLLHRRSQRGRGSTRGHGSGRDREE